MNCSNRYMEVPEEFAWFGEEHRGIGQTESILTSRTKVYMQILESRIWICWSTKTAKCRWTNGQIIRIQFLLLFFKEAVLHLLLHSYFVKKILYNNASTLYQYSIYSSVITQSQVYVHCGQAKKNYGPQHNWRHNCCELFIIILTHIVLRGTLHVFRMSWLLVELIR